MRTYGNFGDFVDFSRSSGGTALRPISYGDELVTNGTFDSDTDWTKGTGWTISGGVASCDGTQVSTSNLLSSTFTTTANQIYLVTTDVTVTAGQVQLYVWNLSSNVAGPVNITSSGTYTLLLNTASTSLQVYAGAGSSFVGTVDNVSIREVLFDQAGAPLTLFNHPADIPRIEYNAAGERLGLLVEEARTNLVTYSNDFTDASWATKTTIETQNVTGPDGVSNSAWTLEDNSITDYLVNSVTVTVPNDTSTHTASFFVLKDNDETRFPEFQLGLVGGTPLNHYVALNTKTGETDVRNNGSLASHTVEDCGTFWRLSFGINNNGTGNTICYLKILPAVFTTLGGSAAMSTTGSIGLYGAQLEAGSFPTSYIPTSGATATRAADVCSIPVSAFGYNQAEGTVVVEFDSVDSADAFVSEFYSDSNNRNVVYVATGNVQSYIIVGGSLAAAHIAGAFVNQHIVALSVASNSSGMSLDGLTAVVDNSVSLPPVTELKLGADRIDARQLNGHIKSIQYIPRRLTNAQLVELTS